MKKLLGIISIILALVAGFFLYNGGKLFLTYHDYTRGVLLFSVGTAVSILYGWSCYFAMREKRLREDRYDG